MLMIIIIMMELYLLNLHMHNIYVNDAGVALGNVLDICDIQKWEETVLEFPPFFRAVWGSW